MKKIAILLFACLGFLLFSCEMAGDPPSVLFDDDVLEEQRQAWIDLGIQNYSFTVRRSAGPGGSVRRIIKNGSPVPGPEDPIGTMLDAYDNVKQTMAECRRIVDQDRDITDTRTEIEYNNHIPVRWKYSLFYDSKGSWVDGGETRIENIQLTQFDWVSFEQERREWIDAGLQNYQFTLGQNAYPNTVVQGKLVTRAERGGSYTIPEIYAQIEQDAEGSAGSALNYAVNVSVTVTYDTAHHIPISWEYKSSNRFMPELVSISGFQTITEPSLTFDTEKFTAERNLWNSQEPQTYNLSRRFRYTDNPAVWWTYEGRVTSEGENSGV
jgi:hypothetical protein